MRLSRILLQLWCNRRRTVLSVLFALGVASPEYSSGILGSLFHRNPVVITSTDVIEVDRSHRSASAAHPVYYTALDVGYRDLGAPMAGDKPPPAKDMVRAIIHALAKAGFLPADRKHQATQLIMFSWGTFYPETMPDPSDPKMPNIQLNRPQMLRFLGGTKLGLVSRHSGQLYQEIAHGITPFNTEAQSIEDVAGHALYVVALAGYALPLPASRRPKLLWTTKISCPALGLVLADTLPTMVATAAPHIGHATAHPVFESAPSVRNGQVHIGTPQVEGYYGSGRWPTSQPSTPPAEKTAEAQKERPEEHR